MNAEVINGKLCLVFEDASEALEIGRSCMMVLIESCQYGKSPSMDSIAEAAWQIDCLMELARMDIKRTPIKELV